MRRSAAFLVPALATPLAAQFVMMSKPEEKAPANLQEWTKNLKTDGFPEWVLLPGVSADWTAQAGTLMDTDPVLLETGLGKESFATTNEVARELRAREGWAPDARWALVGKDGSVLDSGASAPDAVTLQKTLERHGVQGRIQILEAFLGRHPDRLDARERLILYRIVLASKLMKPFLKAQEKPEGKSVDGDLLPPPDLAKPFPDGDDARIWGPCAALLEAEFQSGDWMSGFSAWSFRLSSGGADHSPTMQAVAAQSLPTIEAALQRDPRNFDAWDFWVRLQDIAGGRPIRPLIDSLIALPLPGSSVLPSEYSLGFYIQGTKRRQQWGNIVDLVQPWWDENKDDHWKVVSMDMNGKPADALKGTWDRLLGPLVESYLRLGRAYDADRVVREAMAWRPSPGLPQWSAALAKRCGDDQMASQWARMAVPKQSAQ